MIIDFSTNLGKCRLRVGDYGDLPLLPDEVYLQTLTDTSDSVNRTSVICAQYILAMFAQQTHEKLAQIELWGGERYKQYKDYLINVIKNPSFSDSCPIPYSASTGVEQPLIQFQEDWYNNFTITQSEQLHFDAQLKAIDNTSF